MKSSHYRFLFAGGGTGGHLFPAVAVADEIKSLLPEAEILFVGTKSKIEGRIVPKLGFKFKPIWIKGFSRRIDKENLLFPVRLLVSLIQSLLINIKFRPNVAIGSGGYVAGPAVFSASVMGAKVILLEQNSYPGVTTRLLERYADEIHISFEETKKYLRKQQRIFFTGNPVRKSLVSVEKSEALKFFGMNTTKKTLLVLGGSLGANSINRSVASLIKRIDFEKVQIIWQTGRNDYDKFRDLASEFVWIAPFIDEMNFAYSAADLVLARAGATTVAELLVLGRPSILVPSPNVAENHQYYNAKSLEDSGAAILVEDKNIKAKIFEVMMTLILNDVQLERMSRKATSLAKPEAAKLIAANAVKYARAL